MAGSRLGHFFPGLPGTIVSLIVQAHALEPPQAGQGNLTRYFLGEG